MTGFGVGRASVEEEEISVELRSLNHKFLEVKARLPRELSPLEAGLVKRVKDRLSRGSVEILVKRTSPASSTGNVPTVNLELAREYHRAFAEIAAAIGSSERFSIRDIATQPGVIRLEERTVNLERADLALQQAFEQALTSLLQMREVEGQAIAADLSARLQLVETQSLEVGQLAPRAVEEHQQRLSERIAELASGLPVDPQRLAQEVAFFAERTDVAEEATRLASHLTQFRSLLTQNEPSGRKMDFLVQELNREVNTTGSKSQHPGISARIVSMKAELERIREQVQNVE